MYTEDLKQTLLKKPHFKNVYFNENDDTQYIFHPNANFRKVVSRDEVLSTKVVAPAPVVSDAPKVEVSNEVKEEIKTTKKTNKK